MHSTKLTWSTFQDTKYDVQTLRGEDGSLPTLVSSPSLHRLIPREATNCSQWVVLEWIPLSDAQGHSFSSIHRKPIHFLTTDNESVLKKSYLLYHIVDALDIFPIGCGRRDADLPINNENRIYRLDKLIHHSTQWDNENNKITVDLYRTVATNAFSDPKHEIIGLVGILVPKHIQSFLHVHFGRQFWKVNEWEIQHLLCTHPTN